MQVERRTFLRIIAVGAGAALAEAYTLKTWAQAASYVQTSRIILQNFPLFKQETPYTCGPASLRMVLAFLGHKLSEREIAKRMGTTPGIGTAPWQMHCAYNKYLKEFRTGLSAKDKIGKQANNRTIFKSLQLNRPVIFSWLTENYFKPKTPVGHYSVVIGADQNNKEFTIANPFGSVHTLDCDRFWRLSAWNPKPGDFPDLNQKPPAIKLPPDLVVLE